MKQTAVEWLEEQLDNNLDIKHSWRTRQYIQQAKEMEKQQQGYSDEEVLTILHKRDMYKWEEENEILSVTDWFEQFKKK